MPDRTRRRRGRGGRAPTPAPSVLPTGPVTIDSGTVELVRDRSDPQGVTVLVNDVPSSFLRLDDPARLDFEYMQQMAAIIDRCTDGPIDAVHLGAGACALPRWVEAERPGSRQVAVDVDATLLTLVRDWFALPRSPRLRLRPGDARDVLAALPSASADVVIRDVFAHDVTPAHLCTVELVADVARVLRPGGLYLVNCADRPPLTTARAEAATLRHVLRGLALVAEPGQLKGRRYGNLVLAAMRGPAGPGLDDPRLERALRSLPVPVRLLRGSEVDAFIGAATPLHDG